MYICSSKNQKRQMLLSFSVTNFRSFGRKMTLDLSASGGIKDNPGLGISAVGTSSSKVLNSIAIYGANSSGKSNLLLAASTMRKMVLGSVKLNDSDTLPYEPFLLSTREPQPTRFEIVYFEPIARATYTYGFEYTDQVIHNEWLYVKWPSRSKKCLFDRHLQEVTIDERSYPEGVRAIELTLNNNRLFLSLAGQVGGTISNGVINWFQDKIHVISGIRDTYSQYTRRQIFNSPDTKLDVQRFLGRMKLGFDTIDASRVDFDSIVFPSSFSQEFISKLKRDPIIQVSSIHNVYDESGEVVRTQVFDLDDQESAGSNKIFSLSGPLLDSLRDGITLFIDELDSQLHPLITWKLVSIFNSPTENPNHAQLVFTTHDTSLLSSDLFRRDQIWFTEKDTVDSTVIYSLIKAQEYSSSLNHMPRTDSNYQKNYIQGRYGAIPWLNSEKPEGM